MKQVFNLSRIELLELPLVCILSKKRKPWMDIHAYMTISFLFIKCFADSWYDWNTVSHFSYAPLIKCTITRKRNIIFLFWEYRIYICIILWNFIVIRSEMNAKMDPEGHYPQNTIFHIVLFRMKLRSHCTFLGSNFCYARDKSWFILGNI